MPKRDITPSPATDLSEVVVKLKPVLGTRPGTWLTVLYGVALLLVLFFVLFYPGLRHPGSYLVLEGAPSRATVLVDGKYAGSTPCTVFVPRGTRTVRLEKPFYSVDEGPVEVPGRVFATLLVPQRRTRAYHLELLDSEGLLAWALDDFARNPIIPEIISKTVREVIDSYSGALPAVIAQEVSAFIDNTMYLVSNEQQVRELIIARSYLASVGGILTPQSILKLVEQIAQLQVKYDNLPSWVILTSSKERSKLAIATPWSSAYAARYLAAVTSLTQERSPAASGSPLDLSGVILRPIPAGTLLMGRDDVENSLGKSIDQFLAHGVSIGRFHLAETEVTNRQFQLFVDAEPEWKPSNRNALLSTGLASDAYLASWSDDRYPAGAADLPVTGVSWHAAAAYCAWLQARLSASRPGTVVRLPTEAEWEWAARGGLRGKPYPSGDSPGRSVFFTTGITGPGAAGSSEPNGYGLRDMAGNVWEWCADSYAPAAYLLSSLDAAASARLAADLPETSEKVVRGGAWNNEKELLRVYSRGSQPADWCTPQLGFRPAVVLP
jgi:formylglycine-generating enzyme required for sulfatase activity